MNKITRNKAAEILGVHPQTISNYMRDGLLSGYKDEKGNVYVNGDDVEKWIGIKKSKSRKEGGAS